MAILFYKKTKYSFHYVINMHVPTAKTKHMLFDDGHFHS